MLRCRSIWSVFRAIFQALNLKVLDWTSRCNKVWHFRGLHNLLFLGSLLVFFFYFHFTITLVSSLVYHLVHFVAHVLLLGRRIIVVLVWLRKLWDCLKVPMHVLL